MTITKMKGSVLWRYAIWSKSELRNVSGPTTSLDSKMYVFDQRADYINYRFTL